MPWLDPEVRCNNCGTRVAAESLATCPQCGADLGAVGTQSELREWGRTRQRGRARFLWWSMLAWFVVAGVQCGVFAMRGITDPVVYTFSGVWPAAGYIIGRWKWRSAEREYDAWVGQSEIS